ncbi:hypothetical protein [Maribacter sp. 2-571]|uniref:hypothetical protein n=1 Tax=Maribacter sp. 2-571 TaxID=3417569 RepID=UPI003D34048E
MKKTIYYTCLVFFFTFCSGEKQTSKENDTVVSKGQTTATNKECPKHLMERKTENLNISILLDLSDRIDLPNQQAKDSVYILSLAKVFNAHVKEKKLGLLYDKIEVFFEPAPLDFKINEMSNKLKTTYVKGVSKKEWLPKTIAFYETVPTQIYELSRAVSKKEGYPGSDTWGFFQNHVKDYCIEACRRNILVILTDGYMYHENSKRKNKEQTSYLTPQLLSQLKLNTPNWEEKINERNLGFIPATQGLVDLEVLVIGIQNQNGQHPYAQDIIESYWQKWLKDMGVIAPKIKNADLPSNIEKVINDFILKNNHGI